VKTFKSIQKNQKQLNSLLMEKWDYEKLNEDEVIEEEGEKKDHDGDGDIDSDDYMAAKDKAIKANLEEQHNCKSAHPGMNHDQWSDKYR
jgi:hypothetical protein